MQTQSQNRGTETRPFQMQERELHFATSSVAVESWQRVVARELKEHLIKVPTLTHYSTFFFPPTEQCYFPESKGAQNTSKLDDNRFWSYRLKFSWFVYVFILYTSNVPSK